MSRDEVRDLIGAMAVDAIEDDDERAAETSLTADPGLADELDALREAAGWLGAEAAHAVPAGFDSKVLAVALRAREEGVDRAVESAGVPAPIDALAGEAADFAALLSSLGAEEWVLPTRADLTVHELVAHLHGVERDTGSLLGLWPFEVDPMTVLDHIATTAPAISSWRDRPPADLAAAWRADVEAVIDGARAAAPETRVQFHYLDLSLRSLVVLRTFELWLHGDDILHAVGRPPSLGHPGRIHLMASLVIRGLPLALALGGIDAARDAAVRLVLTGPGGGAWTQPLGDGTDSGGTGAEPATRIVADVHDFCRLVGHRLGPDDLDVDMSGDRDLARAVIAAVRVFRA